MRKNSRLPSTLLGLALLAGSLTAPALAQGHKKPRPSKPPVTVNSTNSGTVVYNFSEKGIIMLCGKYEHTDPQTGQPAPVSWTKSYVGPLIRPFGLLEPGGQYSFPESTYATHPGRRVERRNAFVDGIVYVDGSVWGPRGHYLRDKLADTAREARLQLRDIRQHLEKLDAKAAAQLMQNNDPIVRGRDAGLVHATLQAIMLEGRQLRPDFMSKLEELIDYLGQF